LLALYGVLVALAKRRLTPAEGAPSAADAITVQALGRRQFMVQVGGAAAVITVAGAGIGAALGRRDLGVAQPEGAVWSATNALPNAGAASQPAPGTRPELTPLDEYYRIDINLTPLVIREDTWRLRVEGLVNTPKAYALGDLRAYEPAHQFITIACISNTVGGPLTSTTRWTGVPVRRLLNDWGVQDTATHLRVSSADGFFEYVSLEDIRNDERIMLAYDWDGVPLRVRHGFPLRIYIPDVYGMKQPKWIESIEAVDAWEPGYWVVRSWDREAQMRATSVIDTVATDAVISEGGEQRVPIGGMAHAGARGISRVEVRVDDGPWQAAQLREPMSETTWTLWWFEWPFSAGEHIFTVRCFEGDGTKQLTERRPPHPSGATGLNSKQMRI
jgi:DMSO/TMAO reductase YedYZ molybdopterin-dependent catalytic subunit